MLGLKGHGALRLCAKCLNVVNLRWWKAGLHGCVDHTCLDAAQFQQHTRESWTEVIRRLEACAARLPASRDQLDELEIVHGVNYVAEGAAFSPDFPLSPLHILNDWFHTYLEGGLLDNELGEVMHQLKKLNKPRTTQLGWRQLGEYVQLWTWPKHLGGARCKSLFDTASVEKYNKTKHFTCGASELLSLLPVFRLYFERIVVPTRVFQPGVESILRLIDALDVIMRTRSRHSPVTEAQLQAAIRTHLEAKHAVYGPDHFKYKDHVALHLPSQYAQYKRLTPCFVQERHHKEAKAAGAVRRNTTAYEKGIIEDITIAQLITTESFTFGEPGLVKAIPAKADVLHWLGDIVSLGPDDSVLTSEKYNTGLITISCGDVAIWHDDVVKQLKFGKVLLHFLAAETCMTLVRPLQEQRREHTLVRCIMEDHATLLHSSKLIRAAIFAGSEAFVDVVLRPDELSKWRSTGTP